MKKRIARSIARKVNRWKRYFAKDYFCHHECGLNSPRAVRVEQAILNMGKIYGQQQRG